jgi:hypothetical protein
MWSALCQINSSSEAMSMKNRIVGLKLSGDNRTVATDAYVFLMLLMFPLFTGFRGYAATTVSKYLFFTVVTALWLVVLAFFTVKDRLRFGKPTARQICALIFMALCCLSWALSPYRWESVIGSGRYDGLVTLLLSALIFLGVSAYGSFRRCHAVAFAVSITLCCLVALLQLFGFDPLWLFPGDLCYYDSNIRFSGEFLGTVGNVNLLSAMLSLAIPLFFALAADDGRRASLLYNIPLFFSTLILAMSKVSGGALSVAVCALIAPALLLCSMPRLRRGLVSAGVCLLALSVTFAFHADYGEGVLSYGFAFGKKVLLCLASSAVCFAASGVAVFVNSSPKERTMRMVFLALSAAAFVAALLIVWFWRGESGTVYELSRLLHGQVDDSFGSSRILIWRKTLALIPQRPLLGGGPGTLALRLDVNFSRYVAETGKTISTVVDNAHNYYLQLLADIGVLGLLSYLALIAGCIFSALLRKNARPLILAVLCYCIQDFFGLGLCIVSPIFWIFLGLTQSGLNINFVSEE